MSDEIRDRDIERALLRAAIRAREIAMQTNTPLVIVRDGVLVEETVTGIEPELLEALRRANGDRS